MNNTKQASIYLRVLWYNDTEDMRPQNLNIRLTGENTEEVVFPISQSDASVDANAPWEATEWTNGITYNYVKETTEAQDGEEIEQSPIPYVVPSIEEDEAIAYYRKNIIKNAETEDYAYYTIKMTFVGNGTMPLAEGGTIFKDAILTNSTLNAGTPDFTLIATTDEGMFETDDPIYGDGAKSQYFRGAVENNYVNFKDIVWRIVRINGDGSVRIIPHSGRVLTGVAFNDEESADFASSTLKEELEEWFNSAIGDDDNVVEGHFWNDRSALGPYRMGQGYPTLDCKDERDDYIGKVGIITADETEMAGANLNDNNPKYYLKNQSQTFTMTYYGDYNNTRERMFKIYGVGGAATNKLYWQNVTSTLGANPVINLASDTYVTGSGTESNPYVIVDASSPEPEAISKITMNGTEVTNVYLNGAKLNQVVFNDTKVFETSGGS